MLYIHLKRELPQLEQPHLFVLVIVMQIVHANLLFDTLGPVYEFFCHSAQSSHTQVDISDPEGGLLLTAHIIKCDNLFPFFL